MDTIFKPPSVLLAERAAPMYHPTRGGTRGGAAEFSWEQVRQDKDREHYLGHSVLAPTGRWQKNKDVNWYNKDATAGSASSDAADARRQELLAIKQREEDEINRRLGRKPGQSSTATGTTDTLRVGDALLRGSVAAGATTRGTGTNTAPIDRSKQRWQAPASEDNALKQSEVDDDTLTKEDRRAARKLAKMQVRQQRHEERHRRREERRTAKKIDGRAGDRSDEYGSDSEADRARRHRHRRRSSISRSRSPDERRHRQNGIEPRHREREGDYNTRSPRPDAAEIRDVNQSRRHERRDVYERERRADRRYDEPRDKKERRAADRFTTGHRYESRSERYEDRRM